MHVNESYGLLVFDSGGYLEVSSILPGGFFGCDSVSLGTWYVAFCARTAFIPGPLCRGGENGLAATSASQALFFQSQEVSSQDHRCYRLEAALLGSSHLLRKTSQARGGRIDENSPCWHLGLHACPGWNREGVAWSF